MGTRDRWVWAGEANVGGVMAEEMATNPGCFGNASTDFRSNLGLQMKNTSTTSDRSDEWLMPDGC